jgi:hypothetical protein
VGVQHADRVGAGGVDGAVDREPGRIDAEPHRVREHVAVDIDGDEVLRRHLLEAHPVGIDQEPVPVPRQPRRDVGVDAVVEAQPMDQPVGGRQIDAHRPDRLLNPSAGPGVPVRDDRRRGCAHAAAPCRSA